MSRLRQDPEAPWGEFGPSGLTARRLGLMLAGYGIRPAKTHCPDGSQCRDFTRADFVDAWSRYCPPELDQDAAGAVADPDPSQPELPRSAQDGSTSRLRTRPQRRLPRLLTRNRRGTA